MGLRDQLTRMVPGRKETRYTLSQYLAMVSDYYKQVTYSGQVYPLLNQSMNGWSKTEEIAASLPNYMETIRKSPPAFAAQMVRALVLSQARFTFRSRPSSSKPRRMFGTQALGVLERPWPNATTGELISRMEWHAGLAGNSYVTNRERTRLRVLRPDWTVIVYGSQAEPDDPKGAIDAEVVGYGYKNGGFGGANAHRLVPLLPEEVAHWSPLPDPLSPGLGMSWLTPALRDIQGDQSGTELLLMFLQNGATPNLVLKGVPGATEAQFKQWVADMEASHSGVANAYKTLYLTGGADATVIGSNLQQLDFKNIQGAGETRIAMLSRVPAALLQISEGLQGSSLNSGNFDSARQTFADTWVYPTLQDLAAALAPIVKVPGGAELWFDDADMPILREDALKAAQIEQIKEATIVAYVNSGFTAESAVAAVQGQDISQLVHTDLVSVQLQEPGVDATPNDANSSPSTPVDANAPANSQASRALEARQPDAVPNNYYFTIEAPPALVVPAPQVTIQGDTITVEPAQVSIQPPDVINNVTVQPAEATVTVQGDTINVEPAAVSIPVTVEAAQPAQITVEAPITVEQPDIEINLPTAKPRTKKIRVKRADGTEATATIEESD